MSYCQKNKWERDWMKLCFHVKTPSAMRTLDDGSTVTMYLYASKIREMKPLSKVDPSAN
jgi:hypothetical protein